MAIKLDTQEQATSPRVRRTLVAAFAGALALVLVVGAAVVMLLGDADSSDVTTQVTAP